MMNRLKICFQCKLRRYSKALQDYHNELAVRRAGQSQKSKAMLTNFVKYKTAYDDWTAGPARQC